MPKIPEVPNFLWFSIFSGIVVFILIEIFRPEIVQFKDTFRKKVKIDDAKNGIAPLTLGVVHN